MSTLFAAFFSVVAVLVGTLVLLSTAVFWLVKLCELYEFMRRRQDESRLRERIAELEAALAVATAGGAGGVYRAPAPDPGGQIDSAPCRVRSRFYRWGCGTLAVLSIAIVTFAGCKQRRDSNGAAPLEQRATTPPSGSVAAPARSNMIASTDLPGSVCGGAVQTNGRLSPEVVAAVVRKNLGRLRLCYAAGLRANPNLGGSVIVKFVIDRSGTVTVAAAQDGGSDLADPAVVSCVVRSFGNLSFPRPDDGIATVVYPVVFSPPGFDAEPAPAPWRADHPWHSSHPYDNPFLQ